MTAGGTAAQDWGVESTRARMQMMTASDWGGCERGRRHVAKGAVAGVPRESSEHQRTGLAASMLFLGHPDLNGLDEAWRPQYNYSLLLCALLHTQSTAVGWCIVNRPLERPSCSVGPRVELAGGTAMHG